MSQKKMDAYKYAKKNKKQIEKKQKRNKILGWIIGILVTAALITGCVFLVYYTQKQASSSATETTSDATAQDVADILQQSLGDDGNYTITTEPMETETETESAE